MFLFCNPHNPVGRVYRKDELARMAEICLRHDLVICSDEIHCDLVFSGHHHLPIASLAPEIAARTITLMAPSKTFNIAGLHCSFAVIQDQELRQAFQAARGGMVGGTNVLAYAAAIAAYRDGADWLDQVLVYMQANRDYLQGYASEHLPGIDMIPLEGTYLAWLDCRGSRIESKPGEFFRTQAKVALNEGEAFGPGGEGFVRLNLGCPRATLVEALERMRAALAQGA
jgi:cystathionine beta-lyase